MIGATLKKWTRPFLKLALQTDEFPEWKTKAEIMQQDLKT